MKEKLTNLTKAGGCGCKISPSLLNEILDYKRGLSTNLLIGIDNRDDAAIFLLNDEEAIVHTIDFFTPIVNDPHLYGQIAAANALSDIYAMGGTPFLALSILGFPANTMSSSTVREIIEGAVEVCNNAKVVLGGGHTIDNPQPIFGLTVIGKIKITNIRSNLSAKIGDLIYLTKPLGSGIVSTALKIGKVRSDHIEKAIYWMKLLNDLGAETGELEYVHAVTDVTGFGFLGHLKELCQASKVSAKIHFNKIPVLPGVDDYINREIITSGGKRNWKSYSDCVTSLNDFRKWILSDPQTNGGLIITINPHYRKEFELFLRNRNLADFAQPIGELECLGKDEKLINIE